MTNPLTPSPTDLKPSRTLDRLPLLKRGVFLWRSLGLTTQFLMLTTCLVLALSHVSGVVQKSIAERAIIDGSLAIEQSLAQAALLSAIGDRPLRGELSPGMRQRLENLMSGRLVARYFNKVKLWGVDGQLLFDSGQRAPGKHWAEPAVERALRGETVISLADVRLPENVADAALGSQVYEVYMPLYSTDGRVLAVGEVYCSVELMVARLEKMTRSIDSVRAVVGAIGIFALGLLVHFAHRRLTAQSTALTTALSASERLVRHNAELLEEALTTRRRSAEAMENLLNQVGAELHDGPIQLLSLASLYRGSSGGQPPTDNDAKADRLTRQALSELRRVSGGLLLPELDGLGLRDTVDLAIRTFTSETGHRVEATLDPTPVTVAKPKQIVAYRIVLEALNNARKHADAKGLRVDLAVLEGRAEITIRDDGPGVSDHRAQPTTGPGAVAHPARLGLQYMAHRARSVGASVSVTSDAGSGQGTRVRLSLPLMADPGP